MEVVKERRPLAIVTLLAILGLILGLVGGT